jgi:nucleoid-associated protein YgaU
MSELISNPQPESASRSAGPSAHVAYDGPDGLHRPGIVVRYDAVTDPPDDPDAVEDENPGSDAEEIGSDAQPGRGAAARIRAIVGALGQGLFALAWACLRTAYRYPRWAIVVMLSVVILGATTLTRPANPTLTAVIPPEKPATPPAGAGEPKAPEGGKDEPKPDQTAVAKADTAPATETNGGKKDDQKTGAVTAQAPPPGPATTASPKLADAGAANVTADDKAPPATDPPSSEKESVPAPPPLTDRTVASLVAESPAAQAPAPAPPTPAPAELPAAPAADSGHPDSGLPLLPGSEPNLPLVSPAAATLPLSPVGQPVASGPPAPVEEVKLTGGGSSGNAPPPTTPALDSADRSAGAGPPAPGSSKPGAPLQTSLPQPGAPASGSSPASAPANLPSPGPAVPPPLSSAAVLSGLPQRQGLAPKNEAEPPKAERGHTEAAVGPGAGNDLRAPKSEPVPPVPRELKPEFPPPALPEVKPEANHEAKAPEFSPVGAAPEPKTNRPDRAPPAPEAPTGPASPAPGPEAPGLEPVRPEGDNGGEAHKPNFLKEEDLKPGPQGPSGGIPDATSQPGPAGRPEVIPTPAGGGLTPKDRENVAISAQRQEPPATSATSPASEPVASRLPETTAREEIGAGRLGSSKSEPSGPNAQPSRDVAEADWVRIPNKGRIPPAIAADLDAFGVAGHRGPEPPLDRRGGADTGLGFDSGSSPNPPAELNEGAVAGSASVSTGLGTAVSRVRSSEGSRADAGSARVQPSLHIVERGENFWTISRLYYGSGRYYRALWKANSRKYPNIDEVHINDVVEIPAVEDLDAGYVERPQRLAVGGREEGSARDLGDGPDMSPSGGIKRSKSFPTTRTARTSDADDGVPAGRTRRAAPELELPVGEADAGPARVGRVASADRSGADEDNGAATAIRSTARPRNTAASDRPVYKVRRYDTLRLIARDTLGDPRRAGEIYDLNRDIIDDPTRLTAGQLLELPEDADTRRVTSRDRYRGRD